MDNNIFVSVLITTYKHKEFLSQCIDSIITQTTAFNFEILVGVEFDDLESIDYIPANRNQAKVNLKYIISSKENLIFINNQRTGRGNFINLLENAKGKYIALCEGDDYWTDPYKLQKQVDFLEANPDFNICFTQANTLKENKLELHPIPPISPNGIYTFDDLLEHYNFITTASVVFRKKFSKIPEWIYQLPYGDMGLYFLVSKDAKIKCLPEITSVYRIHEKGMWSSVNKLKKVETQLKFYQVIYNQLNSHQKQLVKIKQKALITKISYQLYKKNRLLRVLKRIQLSNKYKL